MITTAMDLSLNSRQKEAIEHFKGPLLVVAGAGSGKTRVVTERIMRLLEREVRADQILGLTFTNKAAEEMSERVRAKTAARVLITTFHSLGARILRESIHHIGFQKHFSIYDEEDSLKLLKQCLTTLHLDVKKAQGFREEISRAKNALEGPGDVEPELAEIYRTYQEHLVAASAVDFDDLLYLPVRIFQKFPELLTNYQKRWPFLLIDEYQDTNSAQYELVKLLAGEEKNICAVGDPDQSIYSWRGASIRNILQFESDFSGAKVIRLEENFRSSMPILETANALIRFNTKRIHKDLYSEGIEGDPVIYHEAESDRSEADFVLSQINRHLLKGTPASEIAVLYRTNFQSRVLEDAALSKQIPYTIIGGISFYQRQEIKDILAFFRMIVSSSDVIALHRTLNIPKRGIGDVTFDKIRHAAIEKRMPLFDYIKESEIKLSAKQKEALASYISLIDTIRSLAKNAPLHHVTIDVIQKTGYLDYLKLDPDTYEDRSENVKELASKAVEWAEEHPEGTLEEFLSELTLRGSLDQMPSEQRIRFMTLHNAKGLEFSYVYLVGLEEDLLPHASAQKSDDEIEEERRLCYVGITRAKKRLTVTHARFRMLWGSLRALLPSRFLEEMQS